jgi:hypothetical protein
MMPFRDRVDACMRSRLCQASGIAATFPLVAATTMASNSVLGKPLVRPVRLEQV